MMNFKVVLPLKMIEKTPKSQKILRGPMMKKIIVFSTLLLHIN
jgi:hypothetical protein